MFGTAVPVVVLETAVLVVVFGTVEPVVCRMFGTAVSVVVLGTAVLGVVLETAVLRIEGLVAELMEATPV